MNEEPRPRQRQMRADAMRNREQIIRAAVDLIIEQGPSVPMELIARRANVGIATLYRHFTDRPVLLRHVALDTVRLCAAEASAALDQEPDAFAALARYMHDSIDLRIGAVLPILAGLVEVDEEFLAAQREFELAVHALVDAAHLEGSLRRDVVSGDIELLVMRLTSPLPGVMDPETNHRLSHRHLELVLDGLLRLMSDQELPGPALSLDELARIPPQPAPGNAGMTEELRARNGGRCHPR